MRTGITLLQSQVSPARPSDKSSFKMKISMEQKLKGTDRGIPMHSDRNLCQYNVCTTNLTPTDLRSNPGLDGERAATDHLNHGTSPDYEPRLNNTYFLIPLLPHRQHYVSP